jgi:hypothetical protein
MMPKPAMIATLFLVVAVLAFVGLAYQTVPISRSYTWASAAYFSYLAPSTSTFTSTSMQVYIGPATTLCTAWYPPICLGYAGGTVILSHESTFTITTLVQKTGISTYSVTEGLTNFVLAAEALGLTAVTFVVLFVVVISLLTLVTIWLTLKRKVKPRRRKRYH